jgi:hypothetical protein
VRRGEERRAKVSTDSATGMRDGTGRETVQGGGLRGSGRIIEIFCPCIFQRDICRTRTLNFEMRGGEKRERSVGG